MKYLKNLFTLFNSVIKTFFMFIIYFFSGFVKKNNKRWGFGSWGGKEFRGNTKYLYNYVRSHHKEIEIFWISKSKSVHEELLKKEINSIYAYSFNGFIKILTSSIIFCTHRFIDFIPCLARNSIAVQLGHITFTIKTISTREILEKENFIKKIYHKILLFYFLIKDMNYGIYSSEDSEKNLKCPDRGFPKIPLMLGLPKSDYLFTLKTNKVESRSGKKVLGKIIPKNEKVILFCPTHRDGKKFNILNFGFSPEKISHFIEKKKCHFYLSQHPGSKQKNTLSSNIKNFNLINIDGDSIDDMLNVSDLLITDYSSLFADYLIFEKPLIFAKFDHLIYLKNRGIKVNYDHLPGPKVSNWDELLYETNKILYEADSFADSRNNWKNKIYKNLDGNNCKRIAEYFKSH